MTAAWDQRSAKDQRRVFEMELQSWLPQALTFSPYWSSTAERLGIDTASAATRGDLLRIPPTLQADVVGRSGAGTTLVQRPTEGQVKRAGSTSLLLRVARSLGGDDLDASRATLLQEFKPVHVVRAGVAGELAVASSRADLDRAHRTGARAAAVLGIDEHDYVVSAVPAGPSAAFWGVRALALGASTLALHPRGHGDGLDRCVEAFGLVPATAVVVTADEAQRWAELLAAADADVSRVVRVVIVGRPPNDADRQRIRAAWRASGALESELAVLSLWAPDVHRAVWAECADASAGLHTYPDLEQLEVLDPVEGMPTDGAGELALTTVGWSGTTLLRYRTGAAVGGLTTEPCPGCGRTVPRILGPVVDDAWDVVVRRGEVLAHVDGRAVALAVAEAGVDQWVLEVRPAPRPDGDEPLVLHVVGDVDADGLAAAVGRSAGVLADDVVRHASAVDLPDADRHGMPIVDPR